LKNIRNKRTACQPDLLDLPTAPKIGLDRELGIVFDHNAVDLHIFEYTLHLNARL
jgi:hypothetical protein